MKRKAESMRLGSRETQATTTLVPEILARKKDLREINSIKTFSELRNAIPFRPKYVGPGPWLALATPGAKKRRNSDRKPHYLRNEFQL